MHKALDPIMKHLEAYESGDTEALHRLLPLVYNTLKQMAKNQVRRRIGSHHTISSTVLVNEAYIKLFQNNSLSFENRSHFYKIAASCMRSILLDYCRNKGGEKRGGHMVREIFKEEKHMPDAELDLQALDEALTRLEAHDARLAQVVELRYLIGLSIEETAETLGIAPATVKRDWILAKAWLSREMQNDEKAA